VYRPADVLEIRCGQCSEAAMRLVVTLPGAPLQRAGRAEDRGQAPIKAPSLGVRIEFGGGDHWMAIPRRRLELDGVRALLASGDVSALHAIDLELVPLFCPECSTSYCETHWQTWDEWDHEVHWFEERRGRCPKGHERMLHD
jgi:hypothetical protein